MFRSENSDCDGVTVRRSYMKLKTSADERLTKLQRSLTGQTDSVASRNGTCDDSMVR